MNPPSTSGPLPRRVRPYGGETLASYINRLASHTRLTEQRVLFMLRYPNNSLSSYP